MPRRSAEKQIEDILSGRTTEQKIEQIGNMIMSELNAQVDAEYKSMRDGLQSDKKGDDILKNLFEASILLRKSTLDGSSRARGGVTRRGQAPGRRQSRDCRRQKNMRPLAQERRDSPRKAQHEHEREMTQARTEAESRKAPADGRERIAP